MTTESYLCAPAPTSLCCPHNSQTPVPEVEMLPGACRSAATLVLLAIATADLDAQNATAPVDTVITSEHTVTIGGQRVPYRASAGNQPVLDSDGEPIASLFYVYYERSDVSDRTA